MTMPQTRFHRLEFTPFSTILSRNVFDESFVEAPYSSTITTLVSSNFGDSILRYPSWIPDNDLQANAYLHLPLPIVDDDAPIVSQDDGKGYDTPRSYAQHSFSLVPEQGMMRSPELR